MQRASIDLLWSLATRLTRLLEIGEADWRSTAHSLDSEARDIGIDLGANYSSPKTWAFSAVFALEHYVDPNRFPDGIVPAEQFETAEDLFWVILPDWRRSGL